MIKIIFLADDDADDSELFTEAIAEIYPAIVCHWSKDGNELLAKLETDGFEPPDIIFLDVNMPGMNGWQCLTNLKESSAYQNIPVVMYSTSTNKRDVELSLNSGALCFFTKPSDFKQFKKILKEIVGFMNGEKPDPSTEGDKMIFNTVIPTPSLK